MTPKEKAKEIVESYQNIQMLKDFGGMDLEIAKECAKIHVNGIIETGTLEPQIKRHIGYVRPSIIHLEFWFEVLEEIDNL